MKHAEHIQKLAVLHCVYQTIASADGGVDEERDKEAIALALKETGLDSIHIWDAALKLNLHDCFIHVATLSADDKIQFKSLLDKVTEMGGSVELRKTCAEHLFKLCCL